MDRKTKLPVSKDLHLYKIIMSFLSTEHTRIVVP